MHGINKPTKEELFDLCFLAHVGLSYVNKKYKAKKR